MSNSVLSMTNTVAIHQPNFLPWIGYFHKMSKVDTFILLDDVQYPRGKNFGNRVQIKTNQEANWITVPVQKTDGSKNYSEILINQQGDWSRKMVKTISFNYNKAPFFNEIFPIVEQLLTKYHTHLLPLNISIITKLKDLMKLPVELVLSSELAASKEVSGAEKILHLIKRSKGKTYVTGAGAGSRRYIDEAQFQAADISLIWQEMKSHQYPQLNPPFLPNLSILDLLMNIGAEDAKKYLDTL